MSAEDVLARFPAGTDQGRNLRIALEVRREFKRSGWKGILERFYTIRHKSGHIGLIRLNWAQLDLLEEVEKQMKDRGYVRIIILKSRQIGFSTLIQGMQLLQGFLRSNSYAITLSHEKSSSKYLHSMTKLALKKWPGGGPVLKVDTKEDLEFFDPVGSKITIATAGNTVSGRSQTCQSLHASEVAFYTNAETLMLGMEQQLPDQFGMCFKESTGNGLGNYFYKEWLAASSGKSEYVPKFYPWQKHPEYRREFVSPLAAEEFRRTLSAEERHMNENGFSLERLKWRRVAIRTKCQGDVDKFKQEYPANAEEAFLRSGRPTFAPEGMQTILTECRKRKPVRTGYFDPDPEDGQAGLSGEQKPFGIFRDDPEGPFWIYEMPDPEEDYIIGADTAEGRIRSRSLGPLELSERDPDFNALSVIKKSTGEEVCTYLSNYSPPIFGDDLWFLAWFYGPQSGVREPAFLVPEINGPGIAIVERLREYNYPRIWTQRVWLSTMRVFQETMGWRTSDQSKNVMIEALQRQVVEGTCGVRCQRTALHMASMARDSMGRHNAPPGAHDDLAVAHMLAIQGWNAGNMPEGEDAGFKPILRSQEEKQAAWAEEMLDQSASETADGRGFAGFHDVSGFDDW